MIRFSIFAGACLIAVILAATFFIHTIFPGSTVGSKPGMAFGAGDGNALSVSEAVDGADANMPTRLSRALADRNRQYRDMKLKLLTSAQAFTATFDTLAGQQNGFKVRYKIWKQSMASAAGVNQMGGQVGYPDPPPPPDAGFVEEGIIPAATRFEQAFEQYNDDIKTVDYTFYKSFADIYGISGEKKREPIPKDDDLDPVLVEAVALHDHARDVTIEMARHLSNPAVRSDWRAALKFVLTVQPNADPTSTRPEPRGRPRN